MNDVAVLGAGAWGTALAIQAARAGRSVVLWARDPARFSTRENPRLPGFFLPEAIVVTGELPTAALVLLAVPLQQMRAVALRLPAGGPLVVCAKGVESGTHLLPLEVLAATAPGRSAAVLTGPNFAHEVAAGLPAATVAAASEAAVREAVAAALGTPSFRIYGNDDPVGAQVGGAAKNVVAIAAGAVNANVRFVPSPVTDWRSARIGSQSTCVRSSWVAPSVTVNVSGAALLAASLARKTLFVS